MVETCSVHSGMCSYSPNLSWWQRQASDPMGKVSQAPSPPHRAQVFLSTVLAKTLFPASSSQPPLLGQAVAPTSEG